ncbi:hypothetical protein STAIW_v1c01320 [Spiroplasma taiwanense CT-1]|uniref:Uncharacterized protein n=1 Tax=Spiroplasma taiwanense CT-1 TaxID=1276220 RepID=S5MAN4_9MOLU|nr:hypothetical protein STAIW_v1c01320 [Spiroplasma taiwanense CT-1]
MNEWEIRKNLILTNTAFIFKFYEKFQNEIISKYNSNSIVLFTDLMKNEDRYYYLVKRIEFINFSNNILKNNEIISIKTILKKVLKA